MSQNGTSLSSECPSAQYFIALATNDANGGSPFREVRAGSAWLIADAEGNVFDQGGSCGSVAASDYHNAAVLPALRDAATRLPQGSVAHLISDQSWL